MVIVFTPREILDINQFQVKQKTSFLLTSTYQPQDHKHFVQIKALVVYTTTLSRSASNFDKVSDIFLLNQNHIKQFFLYYGQEYY